MLVYLKIILYIYSPNPDMRKLIPSCAILYSLFVLVSCKKVDMQKNANGFNTSLLSLTQLTDIYSDTSFTPHDDDSIERMTVLGAQLPNPYLIPNMRQAYLDLGYDPDRAVVTNLYVRFLPTVDQVATLDSIMDSQGYDLFDEPMDYQVISEGDYYQDPSIPDSLPTWQYAVVTPNFVPPSGITYQVLAQIHIPPDDYTAVETEAESIVGGVGLNEVMQAQSTNNAHPLVAQCGTGYHWDYNLMKCVPNNCPAGYHWDNGEAKCVLNTCPSGYYWSDDAGGCVPYNTTPPPPAPDAHIPAGDITVYDTNLGQNVDVSDVRIVAKRWFKIERGYTDNNGHFQFTRHFKNKVKVNVKFKNDYAQIRNVRGGRFWQMFCPITTTLGIYSGNKSSISYNFIQYQDYGAKGNTYWTAATVHNAVQEYRTFATSEHIGLPPQYLKIFVSKAGLIGNSGATLMFSKRQDFAVPNEFVLADVSSVAAIVYELIQVIKAQMDMVIGYRYETGGHEDITQLLSDRIKETVYHELTHAAQYAALGNGWYTTFVSNEEYEIINNLWGAHSPYSDGNNSFAGIVGLGESWAEYIGQYFADKKYGLNSSEDYFGFGGGDYTNNHPIAGFSSHLNDLENFDPTSSAPFHWIPVGIYYDLMDTRNDATAMPRVIFSVDDQVSGYTNQQMFNAFTSSTNSLATYKASLLQQNGNNQSTQVNSLFSQYGY